ncbi:uncharacterized protein LOC100879350 [Megachile rotundata]|uniref:uncharacterized protein LOC100879350 n=1 Tax=Megachile rotundata TaxID=143995 RepID=UPI000614ACD9|nr:PREDICTED: uncharacterized protein LOC100879350 [Megachile rotundata]XP_012147119.1 PREDICTED: uncharacterized protein LOC100879350 [Megachile rotundata]XP_012147120.1 PREDICTED: uncharacterized protein LOC100879350 [Megachile rotundata]
MFCLKGRNNTDGRFKETSREDDFGWWINNEDDFKSPRSNQTRECQSLGSSESMLSCVDSDDSECYFLAQEFKDDYNDNCEKIELTSLIHQDLDVDLIENDAIAKEEGVTTFAANGTKQYFDGTERKSDRFQAICYTPERLVRTQEYRILTPSPRYLSISQSRVTPENENRSKTFRSRRRLNYLIDPKQLGATVVNSEKDEMALSTITCHDWKINHDHSMKNNNDPKMEDKCLNGVNGKQSITLQTADVVSKKSSYERFNVSSEDGEKMGSHSSFLEDVSSIRTSDWSTDSHNNSQNTPLCLSDELATTSYKLDTSQERCTAVNEVVSILEVLDRNPEKATVLLEEDRFCESTSSHDQLTRLALTIETDANVPGVHDHPDKLVKHLRNKVERLQSSSKDIYKDIRDLRKSFQYDEQKITSISSNANKLRQDVQELRYLDDLLNLLRGELERISRMNWPFIVGRTEEHLSEEMNLIV